jgi:Zn ribbon nucleic-acid-binding protein
MELIREDFPVPRDPSQLPCRNLQVKRAALPETESPKNRRKALDKCPFSHKNTQNSFSDARQGVFNTNMSTIRTSATAKQIPDNTAMKPACTHPRVRVVAREEDVEFVECQECGDVFDSSEFKDMAIEDNTPSEDV